MSHSPDDPVAPADAIPRAEAEPGADAVAPADPDADGVPRAGAVTDADTVPRAAAGPEADVVAPAVADADAVPDADADAGSYTPVDEAAEPSAPRTVRWWRRQPPDDLSEFARGVWSAGHTQLFIATATLGLGLVLVAITLGRGLLPAACLIAMALPFLLSGLLLRSYAKRADGRLRALRLTGVVIAIAVPAILMTTGITYALLIGWLSIVCSGGC
jgi:hypothetical protein